MLLELFPQAKFVLIHRHPYQVYASNVNLARRVIPLATLQRWDTETHCRRVVQVYRLYLNSYFADRHLIPAGNLVEIGFEQLEQFPMATLRHIYEQLNLPSFDDAETAFADYLATIDGYRKNTHPALAPEIKSLLAREWNRSFEEWEYEA